MKRDQHHPGNPAKELYGRLRKMSCMRLWEEEVPRFNLGSPRDRMDSVALIRALGVVAAESGTAEQKEVVRTWLRGLLQDPEEKVRRYAMSALPKLGANPEDEAQVLSLLGGATTEREREYVGRTLDKIGGEATLAALEKAPELRQTELKVRAKVARTQESGAVRMDGVLKPGPGLVIHLRCKPGLETILRDEVEAQRKFAVGGMRSGVVAVTARGPFSLEDLYALRCFATVGFVLGESRGKLPQHAESTASPALLEELAKLMTSPQAQQIFMTFTSGAMRYRIEFVDKGHQRGAVRVLANRAYALCPAMLNDARSAPWAMEIFSTRQGMRVELSPRVRPDPRFVYRLGDVPASSHPPLAASLARFGGPSRSAWKDGEVVWDPFCGSGLELIERALLGGVRRVIGTDLSAEAVAIAAENFAAAGVKNVHPVFACRDFRDFGEVEGLRPGTVTLVISNPPMGKRVPVPNLDRLFEEMIAAAATVLRPGGLLVFANPFQMENPHPAFTLEASSLVDLGGIRVRLEAYRKRA